MQGLSTVSSAMPAAINYNQWILDILSPHLGKRILDVGTGRGQYTENWLQQGRSLVTVDCDDECVANHKKAYPQVPAFLADLAQDDFAQRVGNRKYDTVICNNILEHIEDDSQALARLSKVLEKDGKLLILVPAHQALFGQMDRIAGHYRRYNASGLSQLLQDAGFKVVDLNYLNPLGGVGWWINSKFFHPKTLDDSLVTKQVLFYDRYVQPLSHFLAPLTKRFFGQSIWAVAVKSLDV